MQHAEMADESVQLKTLQTILIIFQSHLYPENEVIADCVGLYSEYELNVLARQQQWFRVDYILNCVIKLIALQINN